MVKSAIKLSVVSVLLLSMSSSLIAGPKYKADVPKNITTPNKVQTKLLGELSFVDGMPSARTVDTVYSFIDLSRATEDFFEWYAGGIGLCIAGGDEIGRGCSG
jgi:hypothetical protein